MLLMGLVKFCYFSTSAAIMEILIKDCSSMFPYASIKAFLSLPWAE